MRTTMKSYGKWRRWVQQHDVLTAGIVLTALSAVLFALGLDAHEIGRDESVSVLVARNSVTRAVSLLSTHEPNPAGYFLMLHFWPHETALTARLLSYVPALAVAPLTYFAARRMSLPAWTAGLLAATSPFLAYYAAETRMYAWLILFGAAALALTAITIAPVGGEGRSRPEPCPPAQSAPEARADAGPSRAAGPKRAGGEGRCWPEPGRRPKARVVTRAREASRAQERRTARKRGVHAVALGAVLAAGAYIHYFAAFTGVAVVIVLLMWRRWRTAFAAVVTAAVLFAPGAVMFVSQLAVTRQMSAGGWQSRVDLLAVWQTFTSLFAGTGDYPAGLPLAVVFILVTLLAFRQATAPPVRILLIFLAVGIGVPLALGAFSRLFTPRYAAASLAPLLILAALGLRSIPRLASRLVTVGLLLACVGLIVDATGRFDGQKLQVKEALALAQANHALAAVQGRQFATEAAFYAPGQVAYAFPQPAVDTLGLWALPPGPPYPPPDHGPIMFFDYCNHPPAKLAGYRFEARTSFPGNLCADLETYGG